MFQTANQKSGLECFFGHTRSASAKSHLKQFQPRFLALLLNNLFLLMQTT
jgi:hypothetical protein